MILLGVRTTYKEDLQATTAELVYESNIRLPGEFFTPKSVIDASTFVANLRQYMRAMRPTPATRHGTIGTFVFKDLMKCTHVFCRHDAVRTALQPPYDGPFKVIKRGERNFTIEKDGKQTRINIERLKPAHLLSEDIDGTMTRPSNDENHEQNDQPNAQTSPPPVKPYVTRSGRRVRFPDRLQVGK